jgi:hypothetical protein
VLVPSPEELEYQQRWMSELGWDADELNRRRTTGVARGVAIGSARRDQLAVDAQFDGFKAGGFTYLLTRYLWQQPATETHATVYNDLKRSTRSLSVAQRQAEQVPIFDYAVHDTPAGQPPAEQPMYFTPMIGTSAEAVVTQVTDAEQIEFWLGGVSSQNLKGDGMGTLFTGIGDSGDVVIEQTQRVGLYGYGRLQAGSLQAVQPGLLLREQVLGIEANPMLKLGLDASLADQMEQARRDLQTVSRIEIVSVADLTDTDYLLGQMTEAYHQALSASGITELPLVNSLGLFTADQRPVANTFGRINEPVTAAINRLKPRFKSLLANQVLSQLLAGQSSPLQVRARVFDQANPSRGATVETRGAPRSADGTSEIPQFPSGTTLKLQVENLEESELYLSVLVINASGAIDVLYPGDWLDPEEAARIDSNSQIELPRPQDETVFQVGGSGGFPEILMLVSTQPLRNALRGMQAIARSRGRARGAVDLQGDEPVSVLDALLDDVDDITRSGADGRIFSLNTATSSAVRLYDTNALATLSAVIQVGG